MKGFIGIWLLFVAGLVKGQQQIGSIDFYGSAQIDTVQILKALELKVGGFALATSKTELTEKLLRLPGVKYADVTIVCCQGDKQMIFIGTDNGTSAALVPRVLSGTAQVIPAEIKSVVDQFEVALKTAVLAGDSEDDMEQGHSLLKNEAARGVQLQFIPLANRYFTLLSEILRASGSDKDREVAALVLAYADDKSAIAKLYTDVLNDPSPAVRNNLLRALHGFGLYAQSHKEVQLDVPMTFLLQMLRSVYWTDRDKALFALVGLTSSRPSFMMDSLRSAVSSLEQMTAWRSEGHALLAFVVLGRLKGLTEEAIFQSWQEDRTRVIGGQLK